MLLNNGAVSIEVGSSSGSTFPAAGGLLGYNYSRSSVTTSYSTGESSGGTGASIGGAVGYDKSYNGSTSGFSDTYWDTTASGTTCAAGNACTDPGITGLTTTQLQSGLPAGFNSSDWGISTQYNDGYPYLSNTNSPHMNRHKTGASSQNRTVAPLHLPSLAPSRGGKPG